ncbi:hypothetical protein [Caminibacter mediatlanticus]|uniref:Uncharacterized protein n=1 Tax=Caminibacter mediatlanticus TB-2 TaxID=391592 RepID=A0AAI9AHI4_9BACT|nr:hypothetical protein [Caminibacter mediatlanticus]EDM23617.1 hypothetical protein CMTB2_05012 [Caminibacter mediatlanticus TB-2]
MKKIFIIFIFIKLFAFEVEFTKVYKKYVIPNKDAIEIITKDKNLTFPFKYIKIKNGYILIGDIDEINMWLNDNFYAPDDAKFKNIKLAIIDMDKIQYKIIQKIKKTYKTCNIKKLIFLTPDEDKIIFKPTYIKTKYKIILECK